MKFIRGSVSLIKNNKTEQEEKSSDNINNIIQQPKLLVIDDEPFNLEILTDYLADAGFIGMLRTHLRDGSI